jgi:hypothetical protein
LRAPRAAATAPPTSAEAGEKPRSRPAPRPAAAPASTLPVTPRPAGAPAPATPPPARAAAHTCGGPTYGRLTPGCPRCDDLAAGAAPVVWRNTGRDKARREAEDAVFRREHFASDRHNNSANPNWCGPVCTFGDW